MYLLRFLGRASTPWAITEGAAGLLFDILISAMLDRANGTKHRLTKDELTELMQEPSAREFHMRLWNERPDMLAFGKGQRLEGSHGLVQIYPGGVGVIDVYGPLYRHASEMEMESGANSTGMLAQAYQRAIESDEVKSILFVWDSPGGEATGINEFAAKIFANRERKPEESYIDGMMASAAAYLGTATSRITVNGWSWAGSLGVVLTVPLPEGRDKAGRAILKDGHGHAYKEFVSAQSPNKRVDAETEEGANYWQTLVNKCADLMINDISTFRAIDPAIMPEQYGSGGIMQGQDAVDAGLADETGTFESVYERMARDYGGPSHNKVAVAGPTTKAAIAGGDNVGLFDKMFGRGAAKGQTATAATEPDQRETLTTDEALAQLNDSRPAIEAKLAPKAALFAQQLLTDKRIKPAMQETAAYLMLAAMTNDALYGSVVALPVRAENSVDYEEGVGTNEELVRAMFASMPVLTYTEERLAAAREGRTRAEVLPPKTEKTGAGKGGDEDTGQDVHTDEQLLALTDQGRRALERKSNGSKQPAN